MRMSVGRKQTPQAMREDKHEKPHVSKREPGYPHHSQKLTRHMLKNLTHQ